MSPGPARRSGSATRSRRDRAPDPARPRPRTPRTPRARRPAASSAARRGRRTRCGRAGYPRRSADPAVDLFEHGVRLRPVRLVEAHDRRAEQRDLVGEVPVQPTPRHPGDLGDLGYRRRANALGAQAFLGRVDQPIADGLGVSGWSRAAPDGFAAERGTVGRYILPRAPRYVRGPDVVDSFRYLFTIRTKGNDGGHAPAVATRARRQDATALKYGDRTWTWREHIAEATAQAAALIATADPARPMHVGALLGNTPDMLRALAAAGSADTCCAASTPPVAATALARDINRVDTQILLTDPDTGPCSKGSTLLV